MRCYGAVVQHNSQNVLSKMFLHMGKEFPTVILKMEQNTQRHVDNNKLHRLEQGRYKSRRYQGTDKDYGPLAQEPDLPQDTYDALVRVHFDKLKKYQADREKIARDTVSQSDSRLWVQLRTEIITASNFGRICRMQKSTSCAILVKTIRYPKVLNTAAVQFGLANEVVARKALELKLGKTIMPCGLFIDAELPYLGATPDGLIDTDGVVEIKCSYSAKDTFLDDKSIEQNTNLRRIFDRKDKNLMNKIHHYFYQVQGQLHVTN